MYIYLLVRIHISFTAVQIEGLDNMFCQTTISPRSTSDGRHIRAGVCAARRSAGVQTPHTDDNEMRRLVL